MGLDVDQGRRVYVHLARGALTANGTQLGAGDALNVAGYQAAESGGS